jgi:transposase-like protein
MTVGLRMDTEHSAITEPVRRLEVFTGAGQRRAWRDEDKARIVAEIATSGDSVCAVARRYGLSPQQLFGWRRQLRESEAGSSEADGLQFVPALQPAYVEDVAEAIGRTMVRALPPRAFSPNGRGRDEDFSSPPAQIPACAANAPGSSVWSITLPGCPGERTLRRFLV